MLAFRSLIAFAIALSIATMPVCGQYQPHLDDEESCSSAYTESSRSAHWSVYVPIVALVGAAIWFVAADGKQVKHDSNDSQDGLGSIADSKRISSSSSYRDSYAKHFYSSKNSKSYLRAKAVPKGLHAH